MTKTFAVLAIFAISSVLVWSINSGHDVRAYLDSSHTQLNAAVLQVLAVNFATLTVSASVLLLCFRSLRQRLWVLSLYYLVNCGLAAFCLNDDSISSLGYFAKDTQAYQNRHILLLAAAALSLLVSILITHHLPGLFALFRPARREKKDEQGKH